MKTSPSRDERIAEALDEAERFVGKLLARQPRRVDRGTVMAAAHIGLVTAADSYDHRKSSWRTYWHTVVRRHAERASRNSHCRCQPTDIGKPTEADARDCKDQ